MTTNNTKKVHEISLVDSITHLIIKNKKPLGILICVFFITGLGFIVNKQIKKSSENKAQIKLFLLSEKLDALKSTKKKDSTAKINNQLIGDFKNFVLKESMTNASQAAALTIINYLLNHNLPEKADEFINEFSKKLSKNSIMSAFIELKKGDALTALNKQDQALKIYNEFLKNSKYKYLHPEAQLKIGLIYDDLKKVNEAEKAYNKVIASYNQSSAAQRAKIYLRLLWNKK